MPLTAQDLRSFTGSEQFYRHGINRKVVYTEGAHYVAEQGGAYWLLDEIAIANMFEAKVKAEYFQNWTLTRGGGASAVLTCDDGNDHVVYEKQIEFTDFPLPSIRFYFTDNTILLPSEY